MVQSRGGKPGHPAQWVARYVPKPITMRTNGIYTTALTTKADNAIGWANQQLVGLRGEWQRVPLRRQTSGTEWDEVPVGRINRVLPNNYSLRGGEDPIVRNKASLKCTMNRPR